MLFQSFATIFVTLILSSTITSGVPNSKKAKNDKHASLPISVKFHTPHGSLTQNDQLRASKLTSLGILSGRKKASVVAAQNPDVKSYEGGLVSSVDVGVGDPPTLYNLIVDTGSSITFVGANKPYVQSSTSKATTSLGFSLYGSGFVLFDEFYDTVSLSNSLSVKNQSIGVTTSMAAEGFTGYDGILGLGPVDLTEGTVIGAGSIPTFPDNLADQDAMSTEVIGISYTPAQSSSQAGEVTFGGTDDSKYVDSITYTPITSSSPSSSYWGIDLDATYGDSNSTILKAASGIVDTGTTLILLASDAFSTYQTATGGQMDQAVGLLKVTENQYREMKSLYFIVGGETFELTRNAQIWPRKMNTVIEGQSDSIYLVVGDLGSTTLESSMDFILGFTFLQRFYSVFDTTNSRVGLAKTSHTYDTSN